MRVMDIGIFGKNRALYLGRIAIPSAVCSTVSRVSWILLLIYVPEAEYIVFEHGSFDYEQENRSVEEKVEAAIKNYFFHDPERFWKYIRPVRKQ